MAKFEASVREGRGEGGGNELISDKLRYCTSYVYITFIALSKLSYLEQLK